MKEGTKSELNYLQLVEKKFLRHHLSVLAQSKLFPYKKTLHEFCPIYKVHSL
jgi:hypothetical protein